MGSIANILMRQGDIHANRALDQSQILRRGLGNIGQMFGDYMQHRQGVQQHNQQLEMQQEQQRERQDAFARFAEDPRQENIPWLVDAGMPPKDAMSIFGAFDRAAQRGITTKTTPAQMAQILRSGSRDPDVQRAAASMAGGELGVPDLQWDGNEMKVLNFFAPFLPKEAAVPKQNDFEQFLHGKYGSNPTPQQRIDGRREWTTAGRASVTPDKPKTYKPPDRMRVAIQLLDQGPGKGNYTVADIEELVRQLETADRPKTAASSGLEEFMRRDNPNALPAPNLLEAGQGGGAAGLASALGGGAAALPAPPAGLPPGIQQSAKDGTYWRENPDGTMTQVEQKPDGSWGEAG